jgi:hypothetical protein
MNIRRELRIAALTVVIILGVALALILARVVVTKVRDMARTSPAARVFRVPTCSLA